MQCLGSKQPFLPVLRQMWGFSLLELIITLLIISLLVSLAMPNFMSRIQDDRLTSQINEFAAALYLTRSEAIKRGVRVTMCKSTNGLACTTAGGWEQGWLIFEDNNSNATLDNIGDLIIKHEPLYQNLQLRGNALVEDYISYTASGHVKTITDAIMSGTLTLCDNRTNPAVNMKKLVLIGSGRFRIDNINVNDCL
jgi:type IV fimbrial biogenesis protein FimT